jgi:radical SAM protein with 4Fe4S-binding SPASM domain
MVAFSTDGYFYPCHRFVGMQAYRIGDLSGLDRDRIRRFVLSAERATKASCSRCAAALICGGFCHYAQADGEGDFNPPPAAACSRYRKYLLHAIESVVIKQSATRVMRRASIPLTGLERLTFLTQERQAGRKRRTTWSVLVGKVHSSRPTASVLPEVEDILAIASVAMRHRVVCTGWAQSGTDGLVECLRGNVRAPRQDPWDGNNTLVPEEHLASFLTKAYGRLRRSPQALLLRQVLWRVVPRRREGIDQRFTRLFSVLESLVLYSSRARGREHLLSKKESRALRRAVRGALTTHVRSKEKRTLVEQKLGELDRPTIGVAFLHACRQAKITMDDLWPLDSQDGVGLIRIRNKFSHGEHVPYHPGLEIAGDHVQWTVERLLLATLGWPTEKSRVRPGSLGQLVAYSSWREERSALTRATGRPLDKATTTDGDK